MKVYLVGGAVRDKLLGYPSTEQDWVVVGSTPNQLLDQGYKQVGKDFPVFLHPDTGEEYALARTERKSGHGYGGFQFCTDVHITLEEDLLRRDLTINAIAEDADGNIIDPYGGQRDLNNKVLRHLSPAFAEDPLRVLRVARFTARYAHLGFTVAPDTLALMKQLANNGELQHLTAERVWKETERALGEKTPRRYIEILHQCDALVTLFPDVDRLFGIPQRADYHPEIDTGVHVLMALDQAAKFSDDPVIRFAVLVHDLGKGNTPKDVLPSHRGHEQRGVELIQKLCKRYKIPNQFKQLALAVAEYHLQCHQAPELKPTTVLKLFKGIGALRQPEKLQQFVLCCRADATGRLGFENQPYPSGDWLLNAFAQLQKFDNQPLIQQGLSGKALGDAIRDAQLDILRPLRQSCLKKTAVKTNDND